MVEETLWWFDEKCIGPRLWPNEVLLLYRLVGNRYWVFRRRQHSLWILGDVIRLRRKLLRTLAGPMGLDPKKGTGPDSSSHKSILSASDFPSLNPRVRISPGLPLYPSQVYVQTLGFNDSRGKLYDALLLAR
jgi:hypothetical protein